MLITHCSDHSMSGVNSWSCVTHLVPESFWAAFGSRRDSGIPVQQQRSSKSFPVQVEELRNIPSMSTKAIEDATAKRDQLTKAKDKEEAKLRQVLASLQEETKGIQKEKQVWTGRNYPPAVTSLF